MHEYLVNIQKIDKIDILGKLKNKIIEKVQSHKEMVLKNIPKAT